MTDETTLAAASKLANGILLLVAGAVDEHNDDPDCNVIIICGFVEALAALEENAAPTKGRERFSRAVFKALRAFRSK